MGHMLPTELELCEQFGISRSSVRTAMMSLVNDGYLKRVKGKGTFVTSPMRLVDTCIYIASFAEEMHRHGMEISNEIMEFRVMRGEDAVCRALQLPEGSNILKLSRLRYCKDHFDDGPIVLNTSYFTMKYSFLQNYDFSSISVHKAMAENGLYRKYVEKHIGAVTLDARSSRLMGVDSTDNESLTKAEMEGRKQVEEIFRFLKKYVPGCENAQLTASGSYVGIRESRHIRGEYRLTADDLLDAKVPEDSILVASNSVDVHGRFGPTSNEYIPIKGDYYGVPYRSLVPVGVDGLLLAGRCVSADSTAAGAIRVMPPSMAMGQAAGCAAAQAVRTGVEPRNIDIAALQRTLRAEGAYLPDVR